MEQNLFLSTGKQTFEAIIKSNNIYVDKTNFLAKLSKNDIRTWFLARPRRFGKSLTLSTLKAIFSDKKALFKGLAIETYLDKDYFAPRPVIHLDLSSPVAIHGEMEFEKSLRHHTVRVAKELGIELVDDLPASDLLSSLIIECKYKYDSEVAVLIDEYDSPVTKLLDKPEEAEKVRLLLREYYMQLKACDKYISFVFVTGIAKNVQGGLYSAFNNYTDISLSTKYGAITGFTHEEIVHNYPYQIKEAAQSLKVTEEKLLVDLKNYYNGFCFDGITLVYNPFSTLRFFEDKKFRNFWFSSGTPEQLISFFKKNHYTIDDFQDISVFADDVMNPPQDRELAPSIYLYQLGYLSLRLGESDDEFRLDYPNIEVKVSIARRMLESYFNSSEKVKSVEKKHKKSFV
jgi:uncharacterized protein (DUF433 family)